MAASDGATVTVYGDGPFLIETVDCRGKSLTIKGAPGTNKPRLQRVLRPGSPPWQPLLIADRSLSIEGLELYQEPASDNSAACTPAHLVYCEDNSLRLVGCRLLARRGSALIVCRRCPRVELSDCQLVAHTLALSVDCGSTATKAAVEPDVQLTGNTLDLENHEGTALSLWVSEDGHPPAHHPARLRLERNTVRAGHVLALTRLPQGVEVSAADNDLTFRQSLLSFAGLAGPEAWRRDCVWRGERNRYQSTAPWIRVEGAPAGVRDLDGWRSLWGATELGSSLVADHP
jgi:hypothetical protein